MVDIERVREYLKDNNAIDFGDDPIKAGRDIKSFRAMEIVGMPWYRDWLTEDGVFKVGRRQLRYLTTNKDCSRADMFFHCPSYNRECITFDDMLKRFDCEDESECDMSDISLSDLYDFMK